LFLTAQANATSGTCCAVDSGVGLEAVTSHSCDYEITRRDGRRLADPDRFAAHKENVSDAPTSGNAAVFVHGRSIMHAVIAPRTTPPQAQHPASRNCPNHWAFFPQLVAIAATRVPSGFSR
jgi:hypothetical protein